MKIKLTKRQHEILYCDSGADQPATDADDPDFRNHDFYGKQIGDELRAGNWLTVTVDVISMLIDMADFDADPDEQRIIKRLLNKVSLSQNHTHDFRYGFHKGRWGSRCDCGKWSSHGKGQPDLVSILRQQSEQFVAKLKSANQ